MMLPVAMALITLVHSTKAAGDPDAATHERNFSLCILLALAYGASIGGMATLIGSPPNGIYMRFMEQTYGQVVSIASWMKVGVPVTLLLFIVSFFVLTGLMFRNMGGSVPGGKEWVRNELRSMGKLSTGEKAVGLCFLIAAVLWFSGAQLRVHLDIQAGEHTQDYQQVGEMNERDFITGIALFRSRARTS